MLTLALLLIAQTGQASVLHVPEQYTTIGLAVNAASNGDSIVVAPGNHRCTVNVGSGRNLHIGSIELLYPDSSQGESVVIQPDSSVHPDTLACFVLLGPDASLHLVGVTLTQGRGARLPSGLMAGGVVFGRRSDLDAHHVLFAQNYANVGISCWIEDSSSATFTDCEFRGNGSDDGEFRQATVRAWDSEVRVVGSRFVANIVRGGAAIISSDSYLQMSDCVVDSNIFHTTSIGTVAVLGGRCDLINVRFNDNSSTFEMSLSAVHVQEATATILNCDFIRNMFSAAASITMTNSETLVSNCSFLDNTALEYGPGTVLVADGHARFVECQFSDNIAPT
ncbi:hypothetical protein IT157_10080, partial [bacterium]|nr:hypothetical protein [bacterium]